MTPTRNRAMVALAAALVLQAGAAGAAQARSLPAANAPAAAAPSRAAALRITEGQVGEVGPGGTLLYPAVTSCLTVTVRLADGGLVGAHASLFQVPGEYRSDRILAALRDRVGTRAVRAVEVRGAVGAWHPDYFTTAIESYPEGAEVPVPTRPDPDGLARAVAAGLGQPRDEVTVHDLPDGDQTVK
ncbi:hypothetical protein ABTY53_21300 [Streptomyces noursei]|uniref:hypothetical protein n=1 Tax=Streptomyces noursei TaxID=1971 RepID=UPI003330EAC6